MLVYDYLKLLKEQYQCLFKRYYKEENKIVEPVVTVAYDRGARQLVFCHPEDAQYNKLEDFKHTYAVI